MGRKRGWLQQVWLQEVVQQGAKTLQVHLLLKPKRLSLYMPVLIVYLTTCQELQHACTGRPSPRRQQAAEYEVYLNKLVHHASHRWPQQLAHGHSCSQTGQKRGTLWLCMDRLMLVGICCDLLKKMKEQLLAAARRHGLKLQPDIHQLLRCQALSCMGIEHIPSMMPLCSSQPCNPYRENGWQHVGRHVCTTRACLGVQSAATAHAAPGPAQRYGLGSWRHTRAAEWAQLGQQLGSQYAPDSCGNTWLCRPW